MADLVRRRLKLVVGLTALAELVVFVAVAAWIGAGWTILATLATSALGVLLLTRQGSRALADLRERARSRTHPGTELGNAGLVAAGGLLMVLPGFIGDLVGLLCLLPGTRGLVRRALGGIVLSRLPDRLRGPVHVRSTRTPGVGERPAPQRGEPLVIEGEVLRDAGGRPAP
ncbi:FxsA family protein [Blastococcus sp. TBT05-19]|uniref:FxsA family protein n=1 Tax=Blastococcus sp. TBT05-19 TaxID=2250581 RepID=UPI000DEA9362|nr:FxsA family protein [Blastococcus sp. TBT05-19]RBY90126.1 FxsA family protein [Blastococcus sp. TBT05-19]